LTSEFGRRNTVILASPMETLSARVAPNPSTLCAASLYNQVLCMGFGIRKKRSRLEPQNACCQNVILALLLASAHGSETCIHGSQQWLAALLLLRCLNRCAGTRTTQLGRSTGTPPPRWVVTPPARHWLSAGKTIREVTFCSTSCPPPGAGQ